MSCSSFGNRGKFPSLATCKRWIRQFNGEGHTRCKHSTGNCISQREHGQDLFNLALYRMVCPTAYLDKVRAYVHNQNPVNPLYWQSQIIRAEQRLRLVCKAASTTSDCAYFVANLFKRQQYWHAQFPDGLQGESTRDIINLDESNYKLETQNRKFGRVTREKRCNARVKYKKGRVV